MLPLLVFHPHNLHTALPLKNDGNNEQTAGGLVFEFFYPPSKQDPAGLASLSSRWRLCCLCYCVMILVIIGVIIFSLIVINLDPTTSANSTMALVEHTGHET